MRIITTFINRMILELLLCRNEEYLQSIRRPATDVIICLSTCVSLIPYVLDPILEPLVTIWSMEYWRTTTKWTFPIHQ